MKKDIKERKEKVMINVKEEKESLAKINKIYNAQDSAIDLFN